MINPYNLRGARVGSSDNLTTNHYKVASRLRLLNHSLYLETVKSSYVSYSLWLSIRQTVSTPLNPTDRQNVEEASTASSSAVCCKCITGQIHNKAEKTQGKRSHNHTKITHQ